jgi:peptidoglycan L-alanyl-D-glutamate endopeptidase CwlK
MADDGVIVDSEMDFAQAVAGTAAPREVLDSLCLIDIRYCGFDGQRHKGQIVIHRELAEELQGLFVLMEQRRFPVAGAVPIICFGWSDEASMAADNSSAFNYRLIAGTDRLSRHAPGRAVDINPRENPAIYPDNRIAPPENPGPSRKTILWSGPSGRRAGAGAGILPISAITIILKRPKSDWAVISSPSQTHPASTGSAPRVSPSSARRPLDPSPSPHNRGSGDHRTPGGRSRHP